MTREEEEGRWVLREDRRRRNVAFENVAKEMLRYLKNSEDVKVGIVELQEQLQLEVPVKNRFYFAAIGSAGEE